MSTITRTMPDELRLELDTLPGDEVFGDELLRLLYGLERSSSWSSGESAPGNKLTCQVAAS